MVRSKKQLGGRQARRAVRRDNRGRDLAKWLGHLDSAASDIKSLGRNLRSFAFPDFEDYRDLDEVHECEVIELFPSGTTPDDAWANDAAAQHDRFESDALSYPMPLEGRAA